MKTNTAYVDYEKPVVIIGATGTISKSFRKYLSNIPGKHEMKEVQKQSYWALHAYSESTNVKVQNTQHGQ
jgi:hypothetical protein